MNKREAKAKSLEGTISIRELRRLIAAARGRGGMSKVNRAIPHERALDIYATGLEGRDDDEVPKGQVFDALRFKMRATKDALMIHNILRDT